MSVGHTSSQNRRRPPASASASKRQKACKSDDLQWHSISRPAHIDTCVKCEHLRTLGSPRQVLGHWQERDAGACEGDGEVFFNLFDNMTFMAPHSPPRHVNEVCW